MFTNRSEALDVFRAWQQDGTQVHCEVWLSMLAATLSGRVVKASEDGIAILSDDGVSQLVLPLAEGSEFRYMDMRQCPTHAQSFDRMLVYFATTEGDAARTDRVAFAEQVATSCDGPGYRRYEYADDQNAEIESWRIGT